MQFFKSIKIFFIIIALVVISAGAQGYDGPLLPWPLLKQADDTPRRSIWTSFGEYQSYGGTPYLHTGIDIRGKAGDKVRVIADGNIWIVGNYDSDCKSGGPRCRVHVKGDDGYIYYYSHLDLGPSTNISLEVRNNLDEACSTGTNPIYLDETADNTKIKQNEILAYLAKFINDEEKWPHLHFSMVDTMGNYDAINPLLALDREDASPSLMDEEDPYFIEDEDAFQPLFFLEEGTDTIAPVTGVCDEVNGDLDIVARIEDTFKTDSSVDAPGGAAGELSYGLYDVQYSIRNKATDEVAGPFTWYRFDRAPIFCAGPKRGNDCDDVVTETDYIDHVTSYSGNDPDLSSVALVVGESYADTLYSDALSCTWWAGSPDCTYDGDTVYSETYSHIVTNSWGLDGSWNTSGGDFPDGQYQVTVVAKDIDGNGASKSRFVFVNNNGTSYTTVAPDIYARDRPGEIGEIPSNPGGEPFWKSPDILVVLKDTLVTIDTETTSDHIEAGVEYDVWLRVHNNGCTDAHDVRGRVYSANPAMAFMDEDWIAVDGDDSYHNPGDYKDVAAGGTEIVGPFRWIPTEEEATENDGHRCLLAFVTSDEDEPISDSPNDVPGDNNLTQLNLQVGTGDTSFYIANLQTFAADVGVQFDCNNLPIYHQESEVELRVEYDATLYADWSDVPGTVLSYDWWTNQLVLRIERCILDLPPSTFPAVTKRLASVNLVLPEEIEDGTYSVDFSQTVDGILTGGMTFTVNKMTVVVH